MAKAKKALGVLKKAIAIATIVVDAGLKIVSLLDTNSSAS